MKKTLLVISCAMISLVGGVNLNAAESLTEAFKKGKPSIELRYRYGAFHEDGKLKDAFPSTLRTALGFETDSYYGIALKVVMNNVSTIGGERYNNTINFKTDRPQENDIAFTDVEQIFARHETIPYTYLYFGRKELNYGNQRFVSSDPWRQHHQTFDGVFIDNFSLPQSKVSLAYSRNLNTVMSERSWDPNKNGSFYIGHFENKSLPYLNFEIYGLHLKFRDPNKGLSSKTWGANIHGDYRYYNEVLKVGYHAEFAEQKDTKNNPDTYNVAYYHFEPMVSLWDFDFKFGYEHFQSDGTKAFQVPFTNRQEFNGFMQLFFDGIPNTQGLNDIAYKFAYTLDSDNVPSWINRLKVVLDIHKFSPAKGSGSYGREWDVGLIKPINDNVKMSLLFAKYEAKNYLTDRNRLWFTLSSKF